MTNEQIDRLNELLVNDSETLTALYDEGITYGMNKGAPVGTIGSLIGVAITVSGFYIGKMVLSKHKKKKS